MKTHRYFGSSESLDSRLDIATKMSRCIRAEVERVGLPLDVLTAAVERDLSRQPAKAAFNAMAMQGVDIMSTLLVDLGAGMGAVATEAAIRGAWPIAIEPGPGLRDIAAERLREVGRGAVLAASGESLPLRDSSVDIVVSLQVLEHVADPKAMLREVFRVLRPGGFFYLTCENYLSWREPHYRVFWYLCCLRRSVRFICVFVAVRRSSSTARLPIRLDLESLGCYENAGSPSSARSGSTRWSVNQARSTTDSGGG